MNRSLCKICRSDIHFRNIAIIWSAGKAGFNSSESQTEPEYLLFCKVVESVQSIASELGDRRVSLHLLSSAGALFEGQESVNRGSSPTPFRPYGVLKFRQERCLVDATGSFTKHIYRASSIYGYYNPNHRQGLIPTLLLGGLRQQVCHIQGNQSTLRDYVCAKDIGRYIAMTLLESESPALSIEYIVSGKPSSTYEIIHAVEVTLGKKVFISFSEQGSNYRNVTFSDDLVPVGLFPQDIRTGVRTVFNDIKARL